MPNTIKSSFNLHNAQFVSKELSTCIRWSKHIMNRIQHCEYVNLGIIYGIANFLNGHSTEIYYVKIGEKLEFIIKIRPASNKAIISLPATSPPPKPPARHRLESSYSSILFTDLRIAIAISVSACV